jgi:sarcosine oxidase subunit beta
MWGWVELKYADGLTFVWDSKEWGERYSRRQARGLSLDDLPEEDQKKVLAMPDPEPRWGFEEVVDETLFDDRRERLAHRYPAAADARIERGWAGLYDMTPDAHPIIGWVADGVYAACGFSGHGFMQSPAVGRAVAAEVLEGATDLDLTPYRLERFAGGATFAEEVVL